MSAFDDKEYMTWHKQYSAIKNPEVEYGAWLAGKRVSEAQLEDAQERITELTASIEASKKFYHPAFDEGDGVYRP